MNLYKIDINLQVCKSATTKYPCLFNSLNGIRLNLTRTRYLPVPGISKEKPKQKLSKKGFLPLHDWNEEVGNHKAMVLGR